MLENSGSVKLSVVLYVFYFVYCKNLQIAKCSGVFQITLDLGVKSQHLLNALFVDGGTVE